VAINKWKIQRNCQQDGKKAKTKYNICWHHYAQTNTNNVNKAWSLRQTTRGRDESNIVL